MSTTSRSAYVRTASAAIVLIVALSGCGPAEAKPASVSAEAAPEPVLVRLAEVRRGDAPPEITGTGMLAAREEIPLGFKSGGVVARVLPREGERVREGQLLAELDTREIDAIVARARAGMAKAARDEARASRLYRDSVVSFAQAQDAATALETARADLAVAEANRRYATVRAGSNGTVLRRLAEPGQTLAPGAPALVIGSARNGTVMKIGLPDRDAVRVRLGDRAVIELDAWPEGRLDAVVVGVGGAADPGTGTVEIQMAVDGAEEARAPVRLISGLTGRARITVRGALAATIPLEAAVEADGERASVYAIVGSSGRVRRLAVLLGAVRGARVVVRSGLDGVSHVVTDGAAYLTDGARVRVVAAR